MLAFAAIISPIFIVGYLVIRDEIKLRRMSSGQRRALLVKLRYIDIFG